MHESRRAQIRRAQAAELTCWREAAAQAAEERRQAPEAWPSLRWLAVPRS
ncbi:MULTISPECIES: hypothetical protein [Paenibacillus]|nr:MULTISPECIES: hypothetical protein [Paenibacillus]